jgi:protein-disulfide isomerase
MKAVTCGGALALALLLTGCGDKNKDGNSIGGNVAALDAAAPIAQVRAPTGDWTQIVAATPEGGFRMGNPNAKVKLVEFSSLTCPHCAAFSAEGFPTVRDKYVKSGQVSFEIRNFVRDGLDLTAALLARCGGPTPYFLLTEQMFAAQRDWFTKLQAMPAAEQQKLQGATPQQMRHAYAQGAGLIQFVKIRGVPEAKAQACLDNEAEVNRLTGMVSAANSAYEIQGTPTFIINGAVVPDIATWEGLEPRLRAAVG